MPSAAKKSKSVQELIQFLPQQYVERFPVAELEDYPGNPKDHDLGALTESIEQNGFYGALVVQDWPETPRYILAGHGRKETLLLKGVTHVPVLLLECDPRAARRILLADNRITELGGFKLPELASFLADEAGENNLRGSGYDLDDVDEAQERLRDYNEALGRADEEGEDDESIEEQARARFALYPLERVVEETFDFFRRSGFPYRELPLHVQMQELNALAGTPQDKAIRSTKGYAVADTYHPHRFHTSAKGKPSLIDTFRKDSSLRRAIRLELETSGAIGDKIFPALSITHGTQAAANFRPGYAMYLYRRFAPQGGTVLDPCTGFGGRLLGWIASGLGGTYVGCDPNTPTDAGNRKMAVTLAPPSCSIELHHLPFEDYAATLLDAERFDFAFTSPPYFTKEIYSDEPTQSVERYPSIEAWRSGFLVPLLAGMYLGCKRGAHCLINIADVEVGSQTYPLEAMTREIALAAGFAHLDTIEFPVPVRSGQGERPEGRAPVFVFQKPQDAPAPEPVSKPRRVSKRREQSAEREQQELAPRSIDGASPFLIGIEKHAGIMVVRDDQIAGGTKRRYLDELVRRYPHVVYASPAFGGAQLAIAYAARQHGTKATIVVAERKDLHARTQEARDAGAEILQVAPGYLTVAQKRARDFAAEHNAFLIEFGGESLESHRIIAAAAAAARELAPEITDLFCAVGSGVLVRGLRAGFGTDVRYHGVVVGREHEAIEGVELTKHPLRFEQTAKELPPFPSCPNYDAKVWPYAVDFARRHPERRVLFWNVMGASPMPARRQGA